MLKKSWLLPHFPKLFLVLPARSKPACVAAPAMRHQSKGAAQWRQIGAGDADVTESLHQLLRGQNGLPIGDVLKNPRRFFGNQRNGGKYRTYIDFI